MNCKPGILAYIVPPARFNLGRVVKVVEAAEDMDGFPAWVVSVDGAPIIGINRRTGQRSYTSVARCPDDVLRPINGVPVTDEVADEVNA
ncbi:hypothetical protein [Paraburkholderia hospita]|uniref:hypothetical protein n=1 Tax=Paraburkholderia hospita TaxID=169430 RepID=UPI000DF0146D|nr:hypothetical protein [Paraburkholderia hospita]AXF04776.1 hypothetical protein CUJ88_41130 [Paraburkholderia hospita]